MQETWSSSFRYWLLSVLVLAFAALLWFARELVTSLIIACLMAFVLDPAVGFLTRHTRISRSLSVNIVYFLGLGSLGTLPMFMLPRLLNEVVLLFSDMQGFLSQIQDYMPQPIVILNWELHFETLLPDFTKILSESITAIPESAFHLIETTSKNLIWGLIILVATYYLLMDWSRLRNQVFHLVPGPYQPEIRRIYREIREIWKGYLRGNLVLMLIVGVVFILAWTAIGLPGALLLGIIMGIFTIIPDLGPAIAAFLAILVALIEGSSYIQISNVWFALLVAGIFLLLINIKGVWLRPLIFGRSVHIHGGVVFIAIMAAVVLQGILGALVIVPVLASIGVLARFIYYGLLGQEPGPGTDKREATQE